MKYLFLFCWGSVALLTAQTSLVLTDFSTENRFLPGNGEFDRHRTARLGIDPLMLGDKSVLTLDLFNDVHYDVVLEQREHHHVPAGLDVYWGSTGDPATTLTWSVSTEIPRSPTS